MLSYVCFQGYICIYVYTCIRTYVCVYVYVRIYIHIYICTPVKWLQLQRNTSYESEVYLAASLFSSLSCFVFFPQK